MAKHVRPDDNSFLISLGRHLGAAVALVAVVAAAFWGIGEVTAKDPGNPVVANSPDPDPTTPAPDPTTPAPTAPEPSAEPSPEPTSEAPSPTAAPSPTPSPTPTPTPEPSPEPSPTATDSGRMDPASISVQVLDAVRDDEQAAAKRVQDTMKTDGYRVVARNAASVTYEKTTVFYSPGHEAKARQIAADYGWSEVAPKPDNLSDSVHVHVVVGRDEA